MQIPRRDLLLLGAAAGLAACAPASKFRRYSGPPVTLIEVRKEDRRMFLYNNQRVLKDYRIALGQNPIGHKQFEGDSKTPEGLYYSDRRNPTSNFHLSIGISYPNPTDRAFARAQGKSPGGDIFIHGRDGKHLRAGKWDWTDGCIAITDREVEDVYAMVNDGTPIMIRA